LGLSPAAGQKGKEKKEKRLEADLTKELKHARLKSTRQKAYKIDTRSDQMTDGSGNAFLFWVDLNARGTLAQPAPTPAGKPTLKHGLGLNVVTPPEVVAPGALPAMPANCQKKRPLVRMGGRGALPH
jgi:hypothetical protein